MRLSEDASQVSDLAMSFICILLGVCHASHHRRQRKMVRCDPCERCGMHGDSLQQARAATPTRGQARTTAVPAGNVAGAGVFSKCRRSHRNGSPHRKPFV